jgi:hypothetical protein
MAKDTHREYGETPIPKTVAEQSVSKPPPETKGPTPIPTVKPPKKD